MQVLRLFEPGTAEARIAMLEGRHPEALMALSRVVDAGWIANWRFSLEHDPIWMLMIRTARMNSEPSDTM